MKSIAGPTTADGANFMRAALDPFADIQLRSVGVPDSFAGNTLKHANTMEITVTPDSTGTIAFVVLPSVQAPIIPVKGLYKNLLVPTFNVSTMVPGTFVLPSFDAGANITALNCAQAISWPTWASNFGAVAQANGAGVGPYSYKSQRVTGQGLEWRYTGTTLSDQGVCTTAKLDAYCVDGYTDKPADPSAFKGIGVNLLQRADLNNMIVNCNETSLSNVPQFVQQSMHTSDGAGGMIVLVAAEEGYVLHPTLSNTAFLHNGTPTASWTTNLSNIPNLGTLGYDPVAGAPTEVFPLIPWQNLRPVGVVFTGLIADAAIVLRIVQRVEATVNAGSAFQQFTDKSPSEDCGAMTMVANVQKTLPVMVPVTMNSFGEWWRKIMGTIGTFGKIIGGIGIPIASPIAGGVGALADIFASL
jgi:hypothetical protein